MSDMAFKFDYKREADRLSAENAALRTDYETACKLVADMHTAAMGAKVGPVVGVVEDVAALRAEVARLKTVPMKYRRMEFNAQLQQENASLRAERDALRDALIELVELKDMKDRLDKPSLADLDNGALQEVRRQYNRRKPLVWAAARAAIERAHGIAC